MYRRSNVIHKHRPKAHTDTNCDTRSRRLWWRVSPGGIPLLVGGVPRLVASLFYPRLVGGVPRPSMAGVDLYTTTMYLVVVYNSEQNKTKTKQNKTTLLWWMASLV